MAQYTIDDIEILRKKSGITYEEAVNLLEYHNGSLARALVDLEKNGRLRADGGHAYSAKGFKGVLNYLYRLRLKVMKGSVTIINLSSLFMLVVALFAPHILIIGAVVLFLLGYRVTGEKNSRDFCIDSLDAMMKTAKENVQNTVNTFSRQFGAQDEAKTSEDRQAEPAPRADAPASGTRPVNVQFPKAGTVDIREDEDGYHEADIQ